jgi:hypothetical protein
MGVLMTHNYCTIARITNCEVVVAILENYQGLDYEVLGGETSPKGTLTFMADGWPC